MSSPSTPPLSGAWSHPFSPLAHLDDSALGRFRTSIGSRAEVHDFEDLTHVVRDDTATPESDHSSSPLDFTDHSSSHVADDSNLKAADSSSDVDFPDADPNYQVEHDDIDQVRSSGLLDGDPYDRLSTIEEVSEHDSRGSPEYVGPHYDDQDVPPTSLDGEYIDVLSTIEEVTEDGFSDGTLQAHSSHIAPESDNIISNSISPADGYRYIQDADIGPAPFTTPHFISNSPKAPVPGPHTAIRIPLGLDKGKWLHLPRNLSGSEINLAELAIFWLWSGYRRDEGRKMAEEDMTTDMAPTSIHAAERRQMVGPPEAPYPMTDSTHPPFLGPRTFIRNSGKRMAGWLLHIPRFLTKEEIQIATVNLSHLCNMPDGWAFRHDPDCSHGVKRTTTEESELIDLLQQQNRATVFLRNVVGLDFAVQDQPDEHVAPIWVKRASMETIPLSPNELAVSDTLVSKPPPLGSWEAIEVDEADASNDTSSSSAVPGHGGANADHHSETERGNNTFDWLILDLGDNTESPEYTTITEDQDVSEEANEHTSRSVENDEIEPTGEGFDKLPRRFMLYASATKRGGTLVFEDEVEDSPSIDEDNFLEQSVVLASPLYVRSMEARDAARIAQESEEPAAGVQDTEEAAVDALQTEAPAVHAAEIEDADVEPSQPTVPKPASRTSGFKAICGSTCIFINQHIRIALPSFLVGYVPTATCSVVRQYIIRPSDIVSFYSTYPERVGALGILGLVVCPFVLPLIWVLLEEADARQIRQLVMMVVVAGYMYLGAFWAVG